MTNIGRWLIELADQGAGLLLSWDSLCRLEPLIRCRTLQVLPWFDRLLPLRLSTANRYRPMIHVFKNGTLWIGVDRRVMHWWNALAESMMLLRFLTRRPIWKPEQFITFVFLLLFTFMFLVSAFRIKIKQFALSNKNKLPVQAFKSLRQQYSKINNEVYLL